ncbi:MAG: surface carbohydrate biosynthesis protein [Desulfuromonadales bacterium]
MAASPSTIIMPVENQVREMDAKILLSSVAAERGYPVLIGSRAYIHFKTASVPRGVYMAKSMKTRSDRMFKLLNQTGHEILAWDEEGLLREPDAIYHRWRLSAVAMRRIAYLTTWGEDNARAFRSFSGYGDTPIRVTGNPRIDLLRPELRDYYRPQANVIREQYGDFILINTNFSKVNHYYEQLGELKNAAETEKTGKVDPFDAGKGRHKLAIFEHFKKMLPVFCDAFADYTIVLRPHPSESQEIWKKIAEAHPNLLVTNEGNVHPWLMAAKVVVANGCTTLVESAILGTAGVNFEPVTIDEYDFPITRDVSRRVYTVDELLSTVREIVDGRIGPLDYAVRKAALEPHIAALEGRLAADRIVDVLDEGGYRDKHPSAPPLADRISGWYKTQKRTIEKRINMRRPGHRNNIALHDHRFPGITAEEISAIIDRFGQLLGRFDGLKVKKHSQHLYWIFNKD